MKQGGAAKSRAHALGQPGDGHARVAGSGHRSAQRRSAQAGAVWPHQAHDIHHYVEEHRRPVDLPADRLVSSHFRK